MKVSLSVIKADFFCCVGHSTSRRQVTYIGPAPGNPELAGQVTEDASETHIQFLGGLWVPAPNGQHQWSLDVSARYGQSNVEKEREER